MDRYFNSYRRDTNSSRIIKIILKFQKKYQIMLFRLLCSRMDLMKKEFSNKKDWYLEGYQGSNRLWLFQKIKW